MSINYPKRKSSSHHHKPFRHTTSSPVVTVVRVQCRDRARCHIHPHTADVQAGVLPSAHHATQTQFPQQQFAVQRVLLRVGVEGVIQPRGVQVVVGVLVTKQSVLCNNIKLAKTTSLKRFPNLCNKVLICSLTSNLLKSYIE